MKRLFKYFFIALFTFAIISCDAKDDANSLINTQFATEIIDSCHILSPKTYSYLHNIKPPLPIQHTPFVGLEDA